MICQRMLINALSALMSEKNRKEEWDVSGRLWHDNIDPSIVGPDSSVILMSSPYVQTGTLAVIVAHLACP